MPEAGDLLRGEASLFQRQHEIPGMMKEQGCPTCPGTVLLAAKQCDTRTCKSLNNLALKSMVKYAFASISSGFHHMISASRCLRRRGEDQTHRLLSIFVFLPSPRLELERKPWFDTQTANSSTTILLQTQYQTFIACDCSAVSHWDITGHISY